MSHDFQFHVEMRVGQGLRVVNADSFTSDDHWLIFYRKPPQGGLLEYWRVRIDVVAGMETKRDV